MSKFNVPTRLGLLLACVVLAVPLASLPASASAAAVTGTGYSAETRASSGSSSASSATGGDIVDVVMGIKDKWLAIGGVIGMIMSGIGVYLAWAKGSLAQLALCAVFALVAAFAVAGNLWNTADNTASDSAPAASAIGQRK